eukprot:8333980-Lingulodinium_polyedra.AAC.1
MSVSFTITASQEQHVGKRQQNVKVPEKTWVLEKKLHNKLVAQDISAATAPDGAMLNSWAASAKTLEQATS